MRLIYFFSIVKFSQYKLAREIDATVISAEYHIEKKILEVSFEFESNGEFYTAKADFSDIKYIDGKLPYYVGLQTKIHVNDKNQIFF